MADIGAVIGGLKDRSYISKLSLQNNRFTGALPASMREFKRAGEVRAPRAGRFRASAACLLRGFKPARAAPPAPADPARAPRTS